MSQLRTTRSGTQVATLDSSDKVVLKQVQLGRDLGDSVEVVSGLSPSDRIINNPPETVAAGDTVRVAAATPTAVAPASTSTRPGNERPPCGFAPIFLPPDKISDWTCFAAWRIG